MTPTPPPIEYGITPRPRRHGLVTLLLLSTGMACLYGLVFLFVFVLSLHIADNSYSLSMVFDGQVLGMVLTVGFAAEILVQITAQEFAQGRKVIGAESGN